MPTDAPQPDFAATLASFKDLGSKARSPEQVSLWLLMNRTTVEMALRAASARRADSERTAKVLAVLESGGYDRARLKELSTELRWVSKAHGDGPNSAARLLRAIANAFPSQEAPNVGGPEG